MSKEIFLTPVRYYEFIHVTRVSINKLLMLIKFLYNSGSKDGNYKSIEKFCKVNGRRFIKKYLKFRYRRN